MFEGLTYSAVQPAAEPATLLVWQRGSGPVALVGDGGRADNLVAAAPPTCVSEQVPPGLPFADRSFAQVVVAAGRRRPEELRQLLREVERVCTPGGRLVVGGSWLGAEPAADLSSSSTPSTGETQGVLVALRRGLTHSALRRARYNFLAGWVSTVWEPGATSLSPAP